MPKTIPSVGRHAFKRMLVNNLTHRLLYVLIGGLVAVVATLAPVVETGSIFGVTKAEAATSSTLNFQARIYSAAGNVVPDGSYSIQYRLYGQETGGTHVWQETQSVTLRNGYFSAYLGSVTAFPSDIDWSQEMWITMNVNSDGEMNPRIKLTAVPYAFQANRANTAIQLQASSGANAGTLSFGSVSNNPNIVLPNIAGTNNVLLQSGTTLMTQGSVPFVDASGRLTQNNSNFFLEQQR
jgi:hypothetical protein